jgi:hypothetical protein
MSLQMQIVDITGPKCKSTPHNKNQRTNGRKKKVEAGERK